MSAEADYYPGGVVSFAQARWAYLVRGDRAIVLASAPDSTRVGVTIYQARKYVSYRECTSLEADRLVHHLELVGFLQRPHLELV